MDETIVLKVKGMTCAHCERRVDSTLSVLKGVSASKANAKQDEVEIVYNPSLAGKANFISAIEDAGYEVEN